MSVYIKGGAWTNVEDEILKAAISKYGLNQWDRVASLLTKKNAKQAKARWNEWLSPAIVRSEWTQEQDSNLLSLAKLFPNQWKSVAAALGRTATQCAERYDHLLAVAAGQVGEEDEETKSLSVTGPGIESLPAKGPSISGETNYETKPSLPDDENMDDDEREMLSEARARLANTKGKKAKRKERERMLEESRRVSLLQKRRELKAAGILMSLVSKNKKSKKEFDHVNDIAHEITPSAGLYDVSEENRVNEKESRTFHAKVRKEGIELNTKSKAEKEAKKSQDKDKKQTDRKHKLSIEAAAQLVDEFNNHEAKRRKIELSEPQNTGTTQSIANRESIQFESSVEEMREALRNEKAEAEQKSAGDEEGDIIIEKSRALLNEKAKEITPLLLSLTGHHEDDEDKDQVQTEKANKKPVRIRLYVVKFLKAHLANLPEPKKHMEPVSEIQLAEEDGATAPDEDFFDGDREERSRNLELLLKVDQELAKLRRSQAIQRGLPLPNPRLLHKDVLDSLQGIEKSIALEFCTLIESDYTKYEDTSYGGRIIDDLDEDLYKQVHAAIDDEIKAGNPQKNGLLNLKDDKFELPTSTESATAAIDLLNSLQNSNKATAAAISQSTDTDSYNQKREKLQNNIDEAYNELVQTRMLYDGYKRISEDEQRAISNRSEYWNQMVAQIARDESDVLKKYREHT